MQSIQSDFDRIAILPHEDWNHNVYYHDALLKQVPSNCDHIMEVGCGTGEFSRLLSTRAHRVCAVDLSPQMIREARERSKSYPNIDYVSADVMDYPLPNDHFDCIASLTTLHHLPAELIIKKLSKALKPGGVFVCLDLYQRSTVTDFLCDGIAYPANLLLSVLKTGRPRPSPDVRRAYAEHGKTDTYLTLEQIERLCADLLPGAHLKRHLFWRYSITWTKDGIA